MNEYLLIKYLHLIAFVYWLGGDLGSFLASRQVINPDIPPRSRQVALKIMQACDMGPKLAMPLILALGAHLAWMGGQLPISKPVLAIVWALCLYWFTMAVVIYLKAGQGIAKLLTQWDIYFRMLTVLVLLGYAIITLASSGGVAWVAWKIIVFAAMVTCSIAIHLILQPFVLAFSDLMSYGPSEATNKIISKSILRCRPLVWLIWAGLFVNAALGTHLVR